MIKKTFLYFFKVVFNYQTFSEKKVQKKKIINTLKIMIVKTWTHVNEKRTIDNFTGIWALSVLQANKNDEHAYQLLLPTFLWF